MKAHELANLLLAMDDREVIVVKPEGKKGYTMEWDLGEPWEDLFGEIRIQVKDRQYETQKGGA